jgi:serine protease Do
MEKENTRPKRLLTYFFILLAVGFFGGVVGSYSYLDYKAKGGTVLNSTQRMTVEENSATIDAVKKVSPAVVSITGTEKSVNFFGNISSQKSAGTGFIVSKDGLIITNKHVVSDANASYTVFTSDGKEYKAEIKATDPLNDIAFLKVNASNLPVVELGNSDSLKIGQTVIAIGNALGQYQNTVTQGVVSALGRAVEAGDSSGFSVETLDNVIQTDAAINSGNSGGPLINLAGQVIGINTAVASNAQSIGFAIPINLAKTDIDSVISKGKVIRPMLGVRYIPITKEFATSNNLPVSEGAYIYGGRNQLGVVDGSPAAKAGLKEGDIITKINNDNLTGKTSLASIMNKYKVGDNIKITYLRDGKEQTANATLAESK